MVRRLSWIEAGIAALAIAGSPACFSAPEVAHCGTDGVSCTTSASTDTGDSASGLTFPTITSVASTDATPDTSGEDDSSTETGSVDGVLFTVNGSEEDLDVTASGWVSLMADAPAASQIRFLATKDGGPEFEIEIDAEEPFAGEWLLASSTANGSYTLWAEAMIAGEPVDSNEIVLAAALPESGSLAGVLTYGEIGIDCEARALTFDSLSNVYAVGSAGAQMLVVKYSSTGAEVWTRKIAPSSGQGTAFGITMVDGQPFIVGGVIRQGESLPRSWVVRLDSETSEIPEDTPPVEGALGTEYRAVVSDGAKIFVTGRIWTPAKGYEIMTRQLDPGSAASVWHQEYDVGLGELPDVGHAIGLTSDLQVIVGGEVRELVNGTPRERSAFLRYQASGDPVMETFFGPGYASAIHDLWVTSADEVFTTGFYQATANPLQRQIITRRHALDGTTIGLLHIHPVVNVGLEGNGVAEDLAGNVIVAGALPGADNDTDFVAFALGGQLDLLLWEHAHVGLGAMDDVGHAVEISPRGYIYSAGFDIGLDGWKQAIVTKRHP